MDLRRLLFPVSAVSLISLAVPVGADEGLGVGTQFAGEIIATTAATAGCDVSVTDPVGSPGNAGAGVLCTNLPGGSASRGDSSDRIGSQELAGKCAYVGVTTLTGQIQFAFGGATESYSTEPASIQPIGTRATCTIKSPPQGLPGELGLLTQVTDIRLSGAVAAAPPGMTPPWPLRPVLICVSGDAQYGPTPKEKVLTQTCACVDLGVTVRCV